MIELFQITNDPDFARRCDALDGVRVFVDLERLGKAERQAGRNTFISVHQMDDVARVKAVLKRARLMVRVNPMNPDSAAEVQAVLARGADLLMLPMFTGGEELRRFPRWWPAGRPSLRCWKRRARSPRWTTGSARRACTRCSWA
jgi:hypothetical protein